MTKSDRKDGKVSEVRLGFHGSFLSLVYRLSSVICCFFFLSCENSESALKEWNESKILAEEARNITSHFSQAGRAKATLTAPLMLRFQADTIYVEFPKSLHVDFYDSTGRKESQLDALYGKYFETSSRVLLRDSVVVSNVAGDTLRCPELWWDQAKGKFYTDKFVRIRTIDKQLYGGRGLEAEQDLSTFTIIKSTGTVTAPPEMAP